VPRLELVLLSLRIGLRERCAWGHVADLVGTRSGTGDADCVGGLGVNFKGGKEETVGIFFPRRRGEGNKGPRERGLLRGGGGGGNFKGCDKKRRGYGL